MRRPCDACPSIEFWKRNNDFALVSTLSRAEFSYIIVPTQRIMPLSTKELISLFPLRPVRLLCPLFRHKLGQIQLPNTSTQIHVFSPHKRRPVIELVRDVECQHKGSSEIRLEEGFRQRRVRLLLVADRSKAGPELGNQDQDVEDEADPGADHSGLRAEGQFVQRVTLELPCPAEADMRQTDRAPRKDGTETTERDHPREGQLFFARSGEESQEAQNRSEKDGEERAATSIDVGEDFGGHALVGQSGEGT